MSFERERRGLRGESGGDAEAPAPGKRALTERLPPGEGAPGAGPAGVGAGGGAEHDDPFWFADGPRAADDGGGGGDTIDPGTMHALYYGINPPRHAEKAYQRGDSAPPLHPRPTTVGPSGTIVALATTIYNRPPFGRLATFSVCDQGGRALHTVSVKTPGKVELHGFPPGSRAYIRPETIGTMVKLLTPEQIAGATEDDHAHRG